MLRNQLTRKCVDSPLSSFSSSSSWKASFISFHSPLVPFIVLCYTTKWQLFDCHKLTHPLTRSEANFLQPTIVAMRHFPLEAEKLPEDVQHSASFHSFSVLIGFEWDIQNNKNKPRKIFSSPSDFCNLFNLNIRERATSKKCFHFKVMLLLIKSISSLSRAIREAFQLVCHLINTCFNDMERKSRQMRIVMITKGIEETTRFLFILQKRKRNSSNLSRARGGLIVCWQSDCKSSALETEIGIVVKASFKQIAFWMKQFLSTAKRTKREKVWDSFYY